MKITVPPISDINQIGTRNHTELNNFTPDDHIQYMLNAGGRVLSGNFDFTTVSYIRVPTPTNSTDAVTKAYADALSPTNLQRTFTAGEAISSLDAVIVTDGSITVADFTQSTSNGQTGVFGLAANNQQFYAAHFTVGASAITPTQMILTLGKVLSPSDSAQFDIYLSDGTNPTGASLANATIAASSLTTSAVAYTLTLNAAPTLAANTAYFVVGSRTGAFNASNYYSVYGQAGSGDRTNSGSWGAYGQTSSITFQHAIAAGTILQASANVTGRYNAFVGFATAAIAAGASGSVAFSGRLTGFTGLTVGSLYYLSNTLGAIATSAGANTRKVGIAVSTTELIITNIW